MTLILTITSETGDEQIDEAIPYLDMRIEAKQSRGYPNVRDFPAELHDVDGVTVLYFPYHDSAYAASPFGSAI